MKEIVNRLHENRQIELAKSILESKGYKVTKKSTKKLNESVNSDEVVQIIRANGYTREQVMELLKSNIEEDGIESVEDILGLYDDAAGDLGVSEDDVIVATEDDIPGDFEFYDEEEDETFTGFRAIKLAIDYGLVDGAFVETTRDGYEAVAVAK